MAVLRVLSLLLVVVSAGASVGPSSNSSLCTESRECLQYQLLCKTDEYEVRHYSPTLWVSTDAEAYFMGVGAAMAFRRLFQYITGENEGGYQIDMTAPVLVKIPEETTMWEPAIYTLSFPLPQAYQERPPQPTNDKLYFTQMPDMDVYVRSYGGWMLSVTSRLQAHQLTKELDRVGAKYNCTHHYGVGYDSPLKLLNRHNEVWYVCEGKPVCADPREPTPPHPPRPHTTESLEESASPDTPSPQPTRDLSTTSSATESPIQDNQESNNPVPDLPIALSLIAATSKPEDTSTRETADNSEESIREKSDISEESTQETSQASEQGTQETSSTQSTSIQPHPTTHDANASISEQQNQSTPTPAATSDSSEEEEVTQSAPDSPRNSSNSTQEVPDSSEQSTHQASPGTLEQSTQGIVDSTDELKTQSTPGLTEKSTHDTPVTTEKSA